MPIKAKLFVAIVFALGTVTFVQGIHPWASESAVRLGFFIFVTLIGSTFKVTLPGVKGTLSVYFLFLLVCITQLTLPETLVVASLATVLQSYWLSKHHPTPVQLMFNLASNATAAVVTFNAYRSDLWNAIPAGVPAKLAVAAAIFFVANTGPVAIIIGLTERKPVGRVWQESYFWSFPYYLVGASLATFINWIRQWTGWEAALLMIPVAIVLFRSYRLYMERLASEKQHAEQVAALHLRTIEALALAIEAKDHVTHDHVQRVQTYAMEVGKEMGLNSDELNALQAAAVLHDIGKLAVPEHIISKPGRLTPEEFEKMKIHPIVGAEILERVRFPYPVAPIVRAHHEKWDGTGYPEGLSGEQIPIGARILSAVDCLDALASDRQYRRAYPIDDAMTMVEAEAGRSFDPKVVSVLKARYAELERKARAAQIPEPVKLSHDLLVGRGSAPDAGLDLEGEAPPAAPEQTFLTSIAAARQEVQTLFEVAQHLGNSLSLPETLSMLAMRLRPLIAFETFAIYVERNGKLIPEYVIGEDRARFAALEIPVGEGLTGWVAENRKAIVNGNPSVEPGYLNDPMNFGKLNSALAVPLEDSHGVVGVLSLYRMDRNAFTRDQLRVLQAITSKVAVAVRNSLMYRQATVTASTDYLTGLPNTRSLFLHLDSELARCRRNHEPLTVLVCDLDGFKRVNDDFGHLTGNCVLTKVATALTECCREYDYVARMGGDEFVIILPGLDATTLPSTLQRIEEAIEKVGIEVCGAPIIRLSTGHAEFDSDGQSVEDLLTEADRKMYANKRKLKLVSRENRALAAS